MEHRGRWARLDLGGGVIAREDLKWLSIRDFRPGIVGNLAYHSLGTPTGYGPGALGAASIEGTFGCIALPQGGIGPMPTRDFSLSIPSQQAQQSGSPSIPFWLVQFHIIGPMYFVSQGVTSRKYSYINARTYPANIHPIRIMLGMDGYDTVAQKRYAQVASFRVYEYGQTITNSPAGQYFIHRQLNAGAGTSDTHADADDFHGPTYFAEERLTDAAPTTLARSCATAVYVRPNSPSEDQSDDVIAVAFPDPTDALTPFGSMDWTTVASLKANGIPVGHQNRMVFLQRRASDQTPTGQTASDDFLRTNDRLWYTRPNDIRFDANGVYNPENVAGYGAWVSTTASDLLLIQHRGGAILIQGDLAYPTVRKLGGVVSTNGVESVGAQTPEGFVYGVNRDGIYAWQGGDGSVDLSPQLPPDFWIHADAERVLDYKGTFACWGDWILAPNGWVYDTAGKSWWRIDDPSVFAPYCWQVDPINGYAYGCVPKWTDGGATMAGYLQGYNRGKGRGSYSWRSQPLFVTDAARRMTIMREVLVVAQGTGTVVVTLEADDGSDETLTFTLSGATDEPQVLRQAASARSRANLRLKVVATGSGSNAAPIVWGMDLGFDERQTVAAA